MNKIDCKLLEWTNSSLSLTLVYDKKLLDKEKTHFLNQAIEYMLSSERFYEPLIY